MRACCPSGEPASDGEEISRVHPLRVELKWHPDIGLWIELLGLEFGYQNSDDDVRHVAERNTTTNDAGVVLEPARPQRVA